MWFSWLQAAIIFDNSNNQKGGDKNEKRCDTSQAFGRSASEWRSVSSPGRSGHKGCGRPEAGYHGQDWPWKLLPVRVAKKMGVMRSRMAPSFLGGQAMNKCDCEVDRLSVETERAIYKIRFGEIQIEITGRCNMNCRHCRGSPDKESGDMPVDQILKIIRFGRQFSSNHSQIVLSGGEPLMHRDFFRVLDVVRANGCDELTLTTNGSLFTSEHMREINGRNFDKVVISVSLDSLDPNDHDEFRQHVGAFQSVHKAIETILSERSPAVVLSLKMTLRPHQVAEMPKMVAYAFKLGCDRVSLSSVCPSGKAITDTALWMNSAEKRRFLETIFRLRKEYSSTFMIDTNDPLKCILRGHSEIGGEGEIVFDGCPAAAVTFNVNANGDLTPCSLLNLPVMNVFGMTVEEMTERYRESDIVKNMLDMKLHGKCGECKHKYQCGGCRARALVQSGDYLGEDPHCWL